MGAYRFSMAPNISVPRSKFRMPFNHATSFNHGKLVPIDCFEILPGDEFKCDFSAIIRMSTPIAPIFGNIKAHVHAFFIPMRLVWNHTKEFYGENKTSAGYQQNSYQIPTNILGQIPADSVSAYLGKPVISQSSDAGEDDVVVSVLKERCYYLVYNEYYRAQQLQNPVLLVEDDTGGIGTITNNHGTTDSLGSNSYSITFSKSPLMNVCKEFDYFTAMTTAPQYGASVTLPLGSTAPVGFKVSGNVATNAQLTGPAVLGGSTNGNNMFSVNSGTPGSFIELGVANINAGTAGGNVISQQRLFADLSNATAASINSIRYAFQVQKWLERANFGSRFFEMLNLHYGVTSPDARLQRPEYLGGMDFYINVDQVVATAAGENSSDELSSVGQTGAVSVTGVKNKNLFNKAFVEPGYVLLLISTTHERSYCQGIRREDSRKDRFDFYFPEFANLGDQAVKAKELYYGNDVDDSTHEDANIGYQEHWAEYRYRPNQVSGLLNPNVANGMPWWTLAEQFTSRPTLSNSFIMEDRNAITRSFVTGATGPDYIADFYFNYTAIREMPLYTIPGLVDHFGVM